jgi:hypothetical protein
MHTKSEKKPLPLPLPPLPPLPVVARRGSAPTTTVVAPSATLDSKHQRSASSDDITTLKMTALEGEIRRLTNVLNTRLTTPLSTPISNTLEDVRTALEKIVANYQLEKTFYRPTVSFFGGVDLLMATMRPTPNCWQALKEFKQALNTAHAKEHPYTKQASNQKSIVVAAAAAAAAPPPPPKPRDIANAANNALAATNSNAIAVTISVLPPTPPTARP